LKAFPWDPVLPILSRDKAESEKALAQTNRMNQRLKKRPPKARAIAIVTEEGLWKSEAQAHRLVRAAAALALGPAPKRGVTILLTDDVRLAALNARFRGVNRATNVLSFPSDAPDYLGDIAIAYGVVAAEARAQGKSFAAHAAHLAAHGVLHLLGYDHERASAADIMEAFERRILKRLGLADPYQRRKAA